jgi:hypothetical protein
MAEQDRWMNPRGLLYQESAEPGVLGTSHAACLSTSESHAWSTRDSAVGSLMNQRLVLAELSDCRTCLRVGPGVNAAAFVLTAKWNLRTTGCGGFRQQCPTATAQKHSEHTQ